MRAHHRHQAVPDIVTMGKPMSNGHPLAGVVTTADLQERFASENMYFNTFGGNEVSAAAGTAVLDVLRDERLLENAQRIGDYVLKGMRALQDKYPVIGDVRGKGMFFAIELVSDRKTRQLAERATKASVTVLLKRGVL